MSDFVVDSSTAIKWFIPEVHRAEAQRLLSPKHNLIAPDFLFVEVGNILWKKVRAQSITESEAKVVFQRMEKVSLRLHLSTTLTADALSIACQFGRTVYDSLYVALAVREQCEVVTADERLYNALKDGQLSRFIRWIEDVPEG